MRRCFSGLLVVTPDICRNHRAHRSTSIQRKIQRWLLKLAGKASWPLALTSLQEAIRTPSDHGPRTIRIHSNRIYYNRIYYNRIYYNRIQSNHFTSRAQPSLRPFTADSGPRLAPWYVDVRPYAIHRRSIARHRLRARPVAQRLRQMPVSLRWLSATLASYGLSIYS